MTESTTETVNVTQRNYLVRLFQGDVSLAITYWIWGVLIAGVGSRIILALVEHNYSSIALKENGLVLVKVLNWLLIAVSAYILIAIWRSAVKFQGNRLWSVLARSAVVLNALIFAVNLWQANDTDYTLDQEILMMHKSLPVMVDKETRLDQVTRVDGNIFYKYSLIHWSVENIDTGKFVAAMTPRLIKTACTEAELRSLVDEGRSLIYVYRDRANMQIAKISVNKSDCM